MARSRNIKPAFFTNDSLAECQPLARLLFIGLWTIADREGRLEDRPKKIKAEILPYDNIDCDFLLHELHENGFIIRYCADDISYIQVVNFVKHQNPHMKEGESTIPAPDLYSAKPGNSGTSPADSLIPLIDSPIPETPLPSKARGTVYSENFEYFWKTYPNRTGKAAAYKAYQSALKTHKELTHAILIDSARRFADAHASARTPSQYIPHPTTWLNQGRWEDDLSRITARSNGTQPAPNARGSQFSALMAAASELMQESGPGESMGQAGLPEWGLGSPFGLQPAAGHGQTGLPQLAHRGDTASGHTIDHDGFNPTDG